MFLLVFVFLLTVSAQKEPTFGEIFASFDTNNDTYLSYKENKDTFAKYDTNKDGTVTRDEYYKYVSSNKPCDIPGYAFDIYDSNKDNKINHLDYEAIFKTVDADNDNMISQDELEGYAAKIFNSPKSYNESCINQQKKIVAGT
ncbi:uncharacterized protein LOC131945934 [Physella acuta]|uniref:uncharacterized protein LOC131945934 n=1 Tax=Physella acuta TaxID=109671 RepID=UPI0027DBDF49|nr:uncharacterized protein LOC131945934 [Physella acuta]